MATSSDVPGVGRRRIRTADGKMEPPIGSKFVEFAAVEHADCVLDVGCGTGSLTSVLAENPGIREIHGVDFSAPYIEYARKWQFEDSATR